MNSIKELTSNIFMMDESYHVGYCLFLWIFLVEACQVTQFNDKPLLEVHLVEEKIHQMIKTKEATPDICDCLMEDSQEQHLTVLPIKDPWVAMDLQEEEEDRVAQVALGFCMICQTDLMIQETLMVWVVQTGPADLVDPEITYEWRQLLQSLTG
ncbi:hypothetical protein C8J56DRAFT_1054271 [Mycena floridula]|nr:hypothetical protein C8J56DRAFT_1054271 [Mycena floridula]